MAEYRPVPIAKHNKPLPEEEEAREFFKLKALSAVLDKALGGQDAASQRGSTQGNVRSGRGQIDFGNTEDSR